MNSNFSLNRKSSLHHASESDLQIVSTRSNIQSQHQPSFQVSNSILYSDKYNDPKNSPMEQLSSPIKKNSSFLNIGSNEQVFSKTKSEKSSSKIRKGNIKNMTNENNYGNFQLKATNQDCFDEAFTPGITNLSCQKPIFYNSNNYGDKSALNEFSFISSANLRNKIESDDRDTCSTYETRDFKEEKQQTNTNTRDIKLKSEGEENFISNNTDKKFSNYSNNSINKTIIGDQNQLNHIDLIHRQGVKSPPMVMEYVTNVPRPYYRLLLPQREQFQKYSCLYCRKKRKMDKYRFSLSEVMQKKGNPYYIGKLSRKRSRNISYNFMLFKCDGMFMATINITCSVGKHFVRAEIPMSIIENYDKKQDGKIILSGSVQKFLQPRLSLKIDSSSRTVLEVINPSDNTNAFNSENAENSYGGKAKFNSNYNKPETQGNRQNKFIIEFNYPLSVFISFAIVCAVESCLQNEAFAN